MRSCHLVLLLTACLCGSVYTDRLLVTTPTTWHHHGKATISFINLTPTKDDIYIAQISIFGNSKDDIEDSGSKTKSFGSKSENLEPDIFVSESIVHKIDQTSVDDIKQYMLDHHIIQKRDAEEGVEFENSTYYFANFTLYNLTFKLETSKTDLENSTFELDNSTIARENSILERGVPENSELEQTDTTFKLLKQLNTTFSGGQYLFELDVDSEWKDGVLEVEVVISKPSNQSFEFRESCKVHLKEVKTFSLIQFNKPLYKPSDTVKIRVLTLNGTTLKPDNHFIKSAYVETTESIKIQLWDEPESHHGLSEFELPLSSEAKSGSWNFCLVSTLNTQCRPFYIEEYAPPRFSLSLTSFPPHLDWRGDVYLNVSVSLSVCARYQHGGQVAGEAHIHMHTHTQTQPSVQILKLDKRGCAELKGTLKRVEKEVVVDVTVFEEETGFSESTTHTIPILTRPSLILSPSCPTTFIPALPYYCYGWVVKENGVAAKGLLVKVLSPSGSALVETPAGDDGFFEFTVGGSYTVNAEELRLFARLDSPNPLEYQYSSFHEPSIRAYKVISPTNTYMQIERGEYAEEERRVVAKAFEDGLFETFLSSSSSSSSSFSSSYSSSSSSSPSSPPSSSHLHSFLSKLLHFTTNPLPINLSISTPQNLTGKSLNIKYMLLSQSRMIHVGNFSITLAKASSTFTITNNFNCQPNDGDDNDNGGDDDDYASPDTYYLYGDDYDDGKDSNNDKKGPIPCSPSDNPTLSTYNLHHNIHLPTTKLKGRMVLMMMLESSNGWKEEIVMDELKFRAQQETQRSNQTKIFFRDDVTEAGKDARLVVEGVGGSLCGVRVVDGVLEGLDRVGELSQDGIGEKLEKYGEEEEDDEVDDDDEDVTRFCMGEKGVEKMEGGNADVRNLLKSSHLRTMTNIHLPLQPCSKASFIPLPYSWPNDNKPNQPPSKHPHLPSTLHSFHDTWLFELYRITTNEYLTEITIPTPKTPTKWVGSGYCIHPQKGLSISPPFTITTLKKFSIHFPLPESIVKGENVVVKVVVVNNHDFPVKASLNITTDSGARIRMRNCEDEKEDEEGVLMMMANGSVMVEVLIRGLLADANITALAKATKVTEDDKVAVEFQDSVTKLLRVKFPGKQTTTVDSLYLCSGETSFLNITPITDTIVRGSKNERIDVSVDIISPLVAEVRSTSAIEAGCGEENLAGVVASVLLLEYLEGRRVGSDGAGKDVRVPELKKQEIEEDAKKKLRIGYQHQLSFKHPNGAYSSFGESDSSGSLYLTSFTVSSFVRASKFIHIDLDNLETSIQFIKKSQMIDGCFPHFEEDEDRVVADDHENDPIHPSSLHHNAFVITSLLQSGEDWESDVVTSGLQCLQRLSNENAILLNSKKAHHDTTGSSLKDDVMYGYVLSLAVRQGAGKEEELKRVLRKVEGSVVDGMRVNSSNRADSVAMTSYLLLSYLNLLVADSSKLQPIATWLRQQIPSLAGQNSNQNKILALEALTKFSTQHPTTLTNITISFTGISQKLPPFTLSPTNQELSRSFHNISLPQRPIKIQASGPDACVMVEAVRSFHLDTFTGDQRAIDNFNISVGSKRHPFKNHVKFLHVCAAYNGPDKQTNMAILSVTLPTGFIADEDSIKQSSQVLGLKRHVMRESKVDFYFDKMTKLESCLSFKVLQQFEVCNATTAIVEVFDYHKPDVHSYAEYSITTNSPPLEGNLKAIKKLAIAKETEERRAYPSRYDDNNDDNINNLNNSNNQSNKDTNNSFGNDKIYPGNRYHDNGNIGNQEQPPCPLCTEHPSFDDVIKLCRMKHLLRIRMENKKGVDLTSYSGSSDLDLHTNVKFILPGGCICRPIEEDSSVEIIVGTEVVPRWRGKGLQVRLGRRGLVVVLDSNVEYQHLTDLFDPAGKEKVCED